MTSWTSRHQKQIAAEKAKRRKGLVWGPLCFIAGILVTLALNQWIVPFLPGPRVDVDVSGLRVTTANFAGCTSYQISMVVRDPGDSVDSTYVKIAFPQNIKGAKVGRPSQRVLNESN